MIGYNIKQKQYIFTLSFGSAKEKLLPALSPMLKRSVTKFLDRLLQDYSTVSTILLRIAVLLCEKISQEIPKAEIVFQIARRAVPQQFSKKTTKNKKVTI